MQTSKNMQLQNQANKIHDKTLTLPLSYYCNRAPCQTTGLCAVPRVSKIELAGSSAVRSLACGTNSQFEFDP